MQRFNFFNSNVHNVIKFECNDQQWLSGIQICLVVKIAQGYNGLCSKPVGILTQVNDVKMLILFEIATGKYR